MAGHDDLVAFPAADLVVTARASVLLHGVVGLDVSHLDRVGIIPLLIDPVVFAHRGSAAQITSTATTVSATATSTTSLVRLTRFRVGSKPTDVPYRP
jgi:hypothetical protein